MNIGIDGYEANVAERVGIGRYAYEILMHLYPLTKNHRVTIFLPEKPRSDMPPESDRWKYKIGSPVKFWTFIGLPIAMKKEKLDVMYSPTHYIPRFTSVSRAMAIMDISYLKYPELFKAKDLYQLRRWTAYSVRHAAKIFTISEASKNDIIKAYRVPEDRVVVTYPGLTMKSLSVNCELSTKNYILSVGTLQPRKNYVRLIEAFSKLDSTLTLIIVGKRGWLYDEILAAPRKFGVEERVKFLDFVADSDLPGLYQRALCFALPSLYEGFGLPVLEAMAYGCPVVVSRVSSLPEIAGKAGIYVDPENVESIVQGLKQGLTAKRDSQDMRAQVKKFTWEKAARQTLDVLEHV